MADSTITTVCPACGKTARVAEKNLGKTAKCPGCGKPFTIKAKPAEAADAGPPKPRTGDLAPGTKLGNFEIVRLLAHGTMGPVYEAHDVLLARAVALKILPAALVVRGPAAVADFLAKANVSNRLEHANILTVYQAGREGELCFFVEELVRGGSAGEFVRQYGPMRSDDALRAVLAAARGLAYAHERNIVHGNVHPNNILLGQEWTVKISDFGLSNALENVGITNRQDRCADLLSPEYCANKPVDIRGDIYSLGASFYYMLTGATPFPTGDRATLFVSHVSAPAPDPRVRNPETPDFMAEVIARAMAKDPADRFQTAGELAAALEGATASAAAAEAPALPIPVDLPIPPRPLTAAAGGHGSSGSNRVLRLGATAGGTNRAPIAAIAGGVALVVIIALFFLLGGPGGGAKDGGAGDKTKIDEPPKVAQPPEKRPPEFIVPPDNPPDETPVKKKTDDDDPIRPLPPLKGKPRDRTVGERFAELNSKVLRLSDDGDPAELGKALQGMRELADQNRGSADADLREFGRNAEEVYRKYFGEFYSDRLTMNLPAPNRTWPGLGAAPQTNGFYRLVDGKRVHVDLRGGQWAIRNGELIIEAGFQDGGLCVVTTPRNSPGFLDFELWYDMLMIGDCKCFVWYRIPDREKGAIYRLDIGRDALELSHGVNVVGDRVIADHKFESARNGWVDLRLIVRGNRHQAYVNGRRAFAYDAPDSATRPGDIGLLVIGGSIAVRDARLAIYDKAPPAGGSSPGPDSGVLGQIQATGSGFAAAEGGYVLTNAHVIRDAKRVYAAVPGIPKPVLTEIIAVDKTRDMALLRLPPEAAAKVKPLAVIPETPLGRGERVAAFGFPLGSELGTGLKLTAGLISALPEKRTDEMYLLDVKVNPGNSGGPLCDLAGNVVGMITVKSFSDDMVDSFGMAITSPELDRFLRRNLKDYRPTPAGMEKQGEWDLVDRKVSGSVLRLLNTR